MDKNETVLVTGATGMVGGRLVRQLRLDGFENVLAPPRSELDLNSRERVESYFLEASPKYVFMVAGRVGGIGANIADPVGFLTDNLTMQLNLFAACMKHRTKKNLFVGSSCIYPRACVQPMKESDLMSGPLEPTNEGYALAKIVGIRLAQSYWSQHGMHTVSVLPPNTYGPGDSFDTDSGHVLSSLVHRFSAAKDASAPSLTLWGTGSARREFLYVDDLAQALIRVMNAYDSPDIINVGTGTDVTIAELARMIADAVGFPGRILWDPTKPDGMPQKVMDVSKAMKLGIAPATSLEAGIRHTVEDYRSRAEATA